jgi:alkaline phosphatase D
MTTMISRRSLIGAGTALLAAPAILRAQQVFAAYPFRLGIASGDPSSDGFVIWTRIAPDPLAEHGGVPMKPIAVDWFVYDDPLRKTVVRKGTATAWPELGHAIHVELDGLEPDRPYWYRFFIGSEKSVLGRSRTLPREGAPLDHIRFGVAGCQNYEDGLYTAYRHLADEDVAFVWHYGDYIYEGKAQSVRMNQDGIARGQVRTHAGDEPYSLDDYRRRYAQYKTDPDLQLAHAAAPWFVTFDDHEVVNNYTGLDTPAHVPPEIFAQRRAAAYQAYYENMPLRRSSMPAQGGMQIYRRRRLGNLLDAHFLDTRQFRSPIPCGGDFNPACPETAAPRAEVLGSAQEQWLAKGLRGGARWNFVAQQVMMMPLDRRRPNDDGPKPILNMDSWAGYDAARERVLGDMAGLGNVVVMTGDEHQNFAGELRRDAGRGEAVAVEFVATSISSDGSGGEMKYGADRVMADNPFLKFCNYRRGYAIAEVRADSWSTHFRVVDQIDTPGGTISTRSVATVERGKPAISLA